ncbi:MAG TPA: AAA family ATPase [Verrucomicrobiae bacterium]|jgi:predicted ATPase|nr:AAA family ATPase [Verrucomicrobiae bacterium]
MRIDWLKIKDWKNLREFKLDFDESQLTTVLIGANAMGKSNLMEAIVRIFRNLDLGEKPDFAYMICYECRGRKVEIDAKPKLKPEERKQRREVEVTVDGQSISSKEFEARKDQLLPRHIFAYYSGGKRRLEVLFDQHLKDFYDATLGTDMDAHGPVRFTVADLTDVKSLIVSIRVNPSPLSVRLWNQFTPEAKEVLTSGRPQSELLQCTLVAELNRIIEGPSLYQLSLFNGIELSTQARELLAKKPRGSQLVRLNRLLLEDAFPLAISKNPLRRLVYCHSAHSHYVLLAYYAKEDAPARRFLADHMGIEGIESVLFVLRNPWWFKGKPTPIMLEQGDPRFWYARGLVKKFMSRVWDCAYPSISDYDKESLDFRGRGEDKQFLYLFIPNEKTLRELASAYGSPKEFFKELETTWINDLIAETRIKVRRKDTGNHVTFQDLSEGEQQLLTVLGLLKFTQDDESLFLLDEPDTHLNPQWKFTYLETLEKVVGPHSRSQMIIATHDPLVIGGLLRKQVRVFLRSNGGVRAIEPDQDPRGMGFAGLLRSQLFGLRATVDSETLKKLDRRAELLSKGPKIKEEERTELVNLSAELAALGFAQEFRDPYFSDFTAAMARREEFKLPTLTPEKIKAQERAADEILDKILPKPAK